MYWKNYCTRLGRDMKLLLEIIVQDAKTIVSYYYFTSMLFRVEQWWTKCHSFITHVFSLLQWFSVDGSGNSYPNRNVASVNLKLLIYTTVRSRYKGSRVMVWIVGVYDRWCGVGLKNNRFRYHIKLKNVITTNHGLKVELIIYI